jgi:hypothetical protein
MLGVWIFGGIGLAIFIHPAMAIIAFFAGFGVMHADQFQGSSKHRKVSKELNQALEEDRIIREAADRDIEITSRDQCLGCGKKSWTIDNIKGNKYCLSCELKR